MQHYKIEELMEELRIKYGRPKAAYRRLEKYLDKYVSRTLVSLIYAACDAEITYSSKGAKILNMDRAKRELPRIEKRLIEITRESTGRMRLQRIAYAHGVAILGSTVVWLNESDWHPDKRIVERRRVVVKILDQCIKEGDGRRQERSTKELARIKARAGDVLAQEILDRMRKR